MSKMDETPSRYSLERSIRYRLLAVMAPILILMVLVVVEGLHLLVDQIVVGRLKQDAESLIAASEKTEGGSWDVDERFLPHFYQRVKSGHYFILRWSGGQIRSRSLWDRRVDPTQFTAGDLEQYLYFKVKNETWVILQQRFRKGGEEFTLWVAEDISAIERDHAYYRNVLLAVVFGLLLVITVWQRRVLRNGFKRLEPVQQALRSNRQSGELKFPAVIAEEIRPLVDSIQGLVQRSSEQVSRSRMLVGNLAHELKRPLLELQLFAEEAKDPETRAQLEKIHAQLLRLIDAELRRARISGNPVPGNLFSFQEELPHLQTLLDRIHDRTIRFETEVAYQQIPFDRDDLLELLGNLLDNAWKYTKSTVRLSVRQNGQRWHFVVEDDGPGVSDAQLQRVNARGIRADESGEQKGHGLGLSICQAIAESYNGQIVNSRSEMGGFRVEVILQNKLVD